jgi:hypothetical protein
MSLPNNESNNLTRLTSIQKSKNKRTVLPKSSLIQVFLDSDTSSWLSSNKKKQSSKILPKLNNQQLLNTINSVNLKSLSTDSIPKIIEKLPTQRINLTKISSKSSLNSSNDVANTNQSNYLINSRQNLITFLAKEFFLDCKQRLDLNSYKQLLNLLNDYQSTEKSNDHEVNEQKDLIHSIFFLIKDDMSLLAKFSAFLTGENALHYDLFEQSIQYEKCYDFFQKLDMLMPNKCAFKKLLQSTLCVCSNLVLMNEYQTYTKKIDELKTKIKTHTKNNPQIIAELEYLFDQRHVNIEPVHEKLRIVNLTEAENKTNNTELQYDLEHINLAQIESDSFILNNANSNLNKTKSKTGKNMTHNKQTKKS